MMSADAIGTPKNKLEACIDSGASQHYYPDRKKFINYQTISGCEIVTADRSALKALGIGDMPIYLPNGDKKTQSLLKDVVHTPEMAFTLILVRHLDDTNCTILFNYGICTIKNPASHVMGMIEIVLLCEELM